MLRRRLPFLKHTSCACLLLVLLGLGGVLLRQSDGRSQVRAEEAVIVQTGFEEGLQGWTRQGEAEFALDREQPYSGRQCARIIVAPGTELSWQQLTREFGPVARGDEFRVTVWLRADSADGTGAYCALQFLDAGARRVGIFHSKIGRDNGRAGWERLLIEGRAPKGTAKARVDLILHAHGTAWFDDVEVVRTAQLTPWPDLGDAERTITIRTDDVVHPRFGGVGFHVFHHVFPTTEAHLNEVIAKRWRELNPSFARLNDSWEWDHDKLDEVAAHLLRLKETGTEVYMTTWGPKDTQPGEERAAYARRVVDNLEYLVRDKGATNIKYYCMTNELSLNGWGELINDLPKFRDYHQELFDELKARDLDIKLLATDASPLERWDSIEWATENMDDITGVYGGHHYINNHDLDDERFYPWFLSKLSWAAGLARQKGKDFIIGEFGAKQDGRVVDGVKRDVCIYWDTPQEPMVGIQLAEAVIAALNAGVYALGTWTFMDFPDDYARNYINKWGTFKRSGTDYSTRAHYYAYGLLTKFFRGPATVFGVECSDPYLRATAVQHQGSNTYSVAVVSRYRDEVRVVVSLDKRKPAAAFRKYVYDPTNVPQHPFGDLQAPTAKMAMQNGRLTDTLAPNTLTVYTTAYDEEPPAPVRGLRIGKTADGSPRLQWQANAEADLCYYRVFRGDRADFALTVQNQIGSTIAAEFVDETAEAGRDHHYKVLAVDQSGNASKAE